MNRPTRRARRLRAERRTLDDLTRAAALVRLGVARRVIVCNLPCGLSAQDVRAIAAHEGVAIDLAGDPDAPASTLAVHPTEPSR